MFIKFGSSGDDVLRAQVALVRRGFGPLVLDGVFGVKTDASARAFQASAGLVPDGVIGPLTSARLGLAATPTPTPTPSSGYSSNFEAAVAFTLAQEGLYSDNPSDHGGKTMRGVTIATYGEYRRVTGGRLPVTEADMRAITADEAKRVAHLLYWNPNFDDLDCEAHAVAIFDWCWGHGPNGAQRMAQAAAAALGARIAVDGVFGAGSASAVNALDPARYLQTFAESIRAWYLAFIARDPSQAVFRNGWMNRVDRVEALPTAKARAASVMEGAV